MKYKKWSLSEKLEILASCEEIGTVDSCRKYSVSTRDFVHLEERSTSSKEKQA